jgi:hypothetical protein
MELSAVKRLGCEHGEAEQGMRHATSFCSSISEAVLFTLAEPRPPHSINIEKVIPLSPIHINR